MGVKRNFLYSSILTLSNYLFPLLTYPYVSRVLGVTNIGICGFIDSIIQYFILLSTLGVVTVGIREVAGNKEDRLKLIDSFSSIFIINGIATILAIGVLLFLIQVVPQLYVHKELLYIGVIKIVGNFLLIEWLYRGIEDFRFITYRSLAIKVLYVISVFVFVKSPNDISIYYLLLSLTVLFNAIVNIHYSRKYIVLSIKNLSIGKYLKPIFILGLYGLITSMYTTFNITFLGFVSTKEEVGYYSTAIKLHTLILAFYTAFTTVMLPKMSSLLAENKISEFKEKISKSYEILISIAIPFLILFVIFTKDVVDIVAGPGYGGAYLPTRIIMPLLLIIGCNQIFIIQILTPLKRDKLILRNSLLGAFVGLFLNLLLVRNMGAIGSSLVWLFSEVVILIVSYYGANKALNHSFPFKIIGKNIMAYLPAIILCILLCNDVEPSIYRLLIATILIFVYMVIIQAVYLKNETFVQISKLLLIKIRGIR